MYGIVPLQSRCLTLRGAIQAVDHQVVIVVVVKVRAGDVGQVGVRGPSPQPEAGAHGGGLQEDSMLSPC